MRSTATISDAMFAPQSRTLTEKQQAFVDEFIANGGKQSAAALKAGYAEGSHHTDASRLVRNPLIQQAITKGVMMQIGLRAASALQTIDSLSTTARSDYVRLEAAKDILDRAGFKPPDRIDTRLDATLTVSLDLAPKPVIIEGGSETR